MGLDTRVLVNSVYNVYRYRITLIMNTPIRDACQGMSIVAFGNETAEPVVRVLVKELVTADPRRAPAASETLRLTGSETVVRALVDAAGAGGDWPVATLGRLKPRLVKPALAGSDLLARVSFMLLLSKGANWLASEDRVMDVAFLAKQSV